MLICVYMCLYVFICVHMCLYVFICVSSGSNQEDEVPAQSCGRLLCWQQGCWSSHAGTCDADQAMPVGLKCIIIIVLCVTIELFLGSFPKNFNIGIINFSVIITTLKCQHGSWPYFHVCVEYAQRVRELGIFNTICREPVLFIKKIQKIHLSQTLYNYAYY